MRTLLVDNYDSFTYNLFHYLAEVNGVEPEVMYNDDPFPSIEQVRRRFDNIVISPGPGSPDQPGDLGRWGEIIRAAPTPLLGVCLGHQGICHFHGSRVGRAPEPRHGRLSPVLHQQRGLFEGIPSPFKPAFHS